MAAEPFYYPPLETTTVKNLEIVRQLAAEHSAYWLQSPYSGDIETLCKKWFSNVPQSASGVVHGDQEISDDEILEGGARFEMLYRESANLFRNLKNAGNGMTEISEKNAYYRTATSLLEKLISLQERALGLKQIHDFHQSVLDIMENTLSGEQRNEVMDRLKKVITGE